MARSQSPAFAIVRYDNQPGNLDPVHERVTVTAVVATMKEAEAEVDRLNEMNSAVGVEYRWQTTRSVTETDLP